MNSVQTLGLHIHATAQAHHVHLVPIHEVNLNSKNKSLQPLLLFVQERLHHMGRRSSAKVRVKRKAAALRGSFRNNRLWSMDLQTQTQMYKKITTQALITKVKFYFEPHSAQ